MPPVVHEVLSRPGRPLDGAARDVMEPRLGHDFGRVRVHDDAGAAAAARAVGALAYTVGHHVVFAAGRYAPQTGEGRRLLAHELAHVVQQTAPTGPLGAAAPAAGGIVLQRKPAPPTRAERQQERRLDELARDPGEAHRAWRRLSMPERMEVVARMRRRYGAAFADAFVDVARQGKPVIETQNYQPGTGPTPDQLVARGFRLGRIALGNAGVEVEVWVHPSGRRVHRDVSTWKPGATGPGPASPGKGPGPAEKQPPAKEPPAEKPPTEAGKQAEALRLLQAMHRWNEALQDRCMADPFDADEAVDAQVEWAFARESLRELGAVDMSAVDPEFWGDVAASVGENTDLRAQCCRRTPAPDPFFMGCDRLPGTL